jgi:hypothetical protein
MGKLTYLGPKLSQQQAGRTSDPMGGCVFMCASGDCRVGNEGLPVDLLSFGVE